MDELMSKLQSVLNDEQSMKQLSEIAGMLSQGQDDGKSDSNQQPDLSQRQKR